MDSKYVDDVFNREMRAINDAYDEMDTYWQAHHKAEMKRVLEGLKEKLRTDSIVDDEQYKYISHFLFDQAIKDLDGEG